MTTNFSIRRVWLLTKHDFIENAKRNILLLLLMYSIIAAFSTLIAPAFAAQDTIPKSLFAIYVGFLGAVVAASFAFGKLRTKAGRINYFLLPATNAEKYVSQLLFWVAAFPIVFFICAMLADATSAIFAPLLYNGYEHSWIKWDALFTLPEFKSIAGIYGTSICGCFLSTGLFFMFSILWPKYTLVKGYVLLYAIEVICVILGLIFMAIFDFNFKIFELIFQDLLVKVAIVQGILAVIAYCAAYWLFTKKDIVKTSIL